MVILLNGSINSGKTTIAKLLQKKMSDTAFIEVDDLRNFVSWMPLAQSIPLNLQNAVAVANNFLKRKLNVIIAYPFSQKGYQYFRKNLKITRNAIYVFTLRPQEEIASHNRGDRTLTRWEKKRIHVHYKDEIANPKFGVVIDSSEHTPMRTAAIILKYLK
ncbi:MAG: chloramphenicol phosphotransferase CPT family protein [Patescibacteria group bacterium]|nr:chloramphenicol phosphotransferase CPT family protein [Patescibacteria group bacterium]